MKPKEIAEREAYVLNALTLLPRKINSLYGQKDNIAEFVLHELSSKDCLNLTKIAYFIDNPDFDCFKGVAGLCQADMYDSVSCIWSHPDDFSIHMRDSLFNNKVKNIARPSLQKQGGFIGAAAEALAKDIAGNLAFDKYRYHSVPAKHDNHLLFMYEHGDENGHWFDDLIMNSLSFLVFCPVHY